MLSLSSIKQTFHKKSIWQKLRKWLHPIKSLSTSLLEDRGVDELEEAIASLFFEGSLETGDLTYVSNARHIALLGQALQCYRRCN